MEYTRSACTGTTPASSGITLCHLDIPPGQGLLTYSGVVGMFRFPHAVREPRHFFLVPSLRESLLLRKTRGQLRAEIALRVQSPAAAFCQPKREAQRPHPRVLCRHPQEVIEVRHGPKTHQPGKGHHVPSNLVEDKRSQSKPEHQHCRHQELPHAGHRRLRAKPQVLPGRLRHRH